MIMLSTSTAIFFTYASVFLRNGGNDNTRVGIKNSKLAWDEKYRIIVKQYVIVVLLYEKYSLAHL